MDANPINETTINKRKISYENQSYRRLRHGGPVPQRCRHRVARSKWSRPQRAWLRRPAPVPGRTRCPPSRLSPNQWRGLPQWRLADKLPRRRHGPRQRWRPRRAVWLARWNWPAQRQRHLPVQPLGTNSEVAPALRRAGGEPLAACSTSLAARCYSQMFLMRRNTPSTMMLPAK